MYKRKPKSMIALLLVLCMILTILPGASLRSEAAEAEAEPQAAEEELHTFQLDADCKILNYVHEDVFTSANHVARLMEAETPSSYVFLNEDGTTTVYYMAEAVKFVDANGITQEKDLTLTATVGGYTTTKNDFGLTISQNPANGVSLVWNNKSVRLIPQGGTAAETVVENNAVRYVDYYGAGMDLVYTPTLTGVKEDIVLESYTGQNTFTFMLNTGGLNLYSANGRYFLASSKTATDRIELGEVVTFDARGRFSVGTMTAQTVKPGQIYQLTLTVDEAFLTDPNTTYPVSVDPQLTISDNTHGANAIEDVSIYLSKPTTNGNWTYLHSGYYDSTYGVARTLFRLTGLIGSSEYQSLNASKVNSAYFHIWEASGTTAMNVNLRANTGSSTWSESGATWNNAGVTLGTTYDTENIGANAKATFDITTLVRAWLNGTENAQKGFVLQNSSEITIDKAFYSSEYGTASYRPYVVLNYETTVPTITLSKTSVAMFVNGVETITATTSLSGQTITWTSDDSTIATVSNGRITGKRAGVTHIRASVGGVTASCLVCVKIPDGIYYLKNANSNYYLDAGAQIASDTDIKQDLKCVSGIDMRAQLWRIQYLGNGHYSIRPMHRPKMGLHTDSSDVNLVNIGMAQTHTALTNTARWTITSETEGYVFRCDNSSNRVLTPQYSSTSAGMIVNAVPYVSGNRAQKWVLEEAPSFTDQLILYDEETGEFATYSTRPVRCVKPGDSVEFSELGLETAFSSMNTINQTVTWSSSDSSVVSVNQNTGKITGVSKGKATITATAATSDGGTRVNHYTVQCYPYWVKVNVFYDHGYLSRYPDAVARINSHMGVLQALFKENYEIYLDYKSPVMFESLADSCGSAGNNIEGVCSCDGEPCVDSLCSPSNASLTKSQYHHKNYKNILANIPEGTTPPDNITSASIYFIGHEVCNADVCSDSGDSSDSGDFLATGLALFDYGICSIFSFEGVNWTSDSELTSLTVQDVEYRTVVHEFGHLFDVVDHYGNGAKSTYEMNNNSNTGPYSMFCIYGEAWKHKDVYKNSTICNGCKQTILANLSTYME